MAGKRLSERIANFCIAHRRVIVAAIGAATLLLLVFALKQDVRTDFADLMPRRHAYVGVHQQFKESFGGTNVVSIMIRARRGDIFQPRVLEKIQNVTRELRQVSGVSQFQIISLASSKLKQVHASTSGIESRPLMWPDVPGDEQGIARLREAVLTNPLVYGSYVSFDLKSALVTADFIDHLMDYQKVFDEIMAIAARHEDGDVELSVVGEPILQGWVRQHLPRTALIFVLTLAAMGVILFVLFMRSARGTVLPLMNAVITGIWGLGLARLLGLNFDPLAIVIAFLITARVTSHCVQAVTRFDEMIAGGAESSVAAARASLAELWRPGLLGVITDAGGILVVALAPIPLLQKTALIGAIWVLCIAVTGVILTPLLLSWLPARGGIDARHSGFNRLLDRSLMFYARLSAGAGSRVIVGAAFAVLLACGLFAFRITVGDASPGTPLLWPDSPYNRAMTEINKNFLGTDRMFVVVSGAQEGALKEPVVLQQTARFQRYMELQPEIGGSVSLADLIPSVNRVLNEGNPRFLDLGADASQNGELLYMYIAGADPDDLDRFTDSAYAHGSVTLFFRNHTGETIRTAVARARRFIEENDLGAVKIQLAGGLVGVLAAVNEVIFAGQVESLALALLVVLASCGLTYRSGIAGLCFLAPILLSNVVTFAFMVAMGIGLNISSLPVAALGIGLGVDYAIYVVDSIRENYARLGDLDAATAVAYRTAGRGVAVTALPMIVCISLWYVYSPMRFQAEMAILIALWMGVSAVSALLVMPALIHVFRPRFILATAPAAGATPEAGTLAGVVMSDAD